MNRAVPVALVLLGAVLAACSTPRSRDFTRYYDPQGAFSTILPSANQLQTMPPQPSQSGPGLLSGVVASPQQPSPSAQDQLGGAFGGLGQQAVPEDRTIYEVLVVTTDTFADLDAMVLYFLTGDPSIDVLIDRDERFGGGVGRLVVAQVTQQGRPTAGVAAEMTLGSGGVGYLLVAIFPPGDWSKEGPDFGRVASSFTPGVPPTLQSFPLAGGAS